MKGKTFLILLVIAGVLAGLTILRTGGGDKRDKVQMGSPLLADLPVNRVARITIAGPDETVHLVSTDGGWQVEERDGYPADFDALREMVLKLSRLKIGRRFTTDEAGLARMSLLDPSSTAASGKGTRITLDDASGKPLADLILGSVRSTEDGGSGGQYLKRVGGDAVYLVDNTFRFLKTTPAGWLEKEMLNIPAEAVASVTVYDAADQAPVYTLTRPKRGQPVQLHPLPTGKTADPAKVDQVLDALSPLTLDDVAAAHGAPATGRRLAYRLFDGREISIFPSVADGDRYTLRVTAQSTPALETDEADAADGAAPDEQSADKAAPPADEKKPAGRNAKAIDDALAPWIFSVKKWQFDSFITDPAGLLEKPQPAAGTDS